MSKLTTGTSAHPVPAYFVVTYLLSWPLFLLVLFVLPQNMAAQGTLGSLAVFTPAFAAMIVARRIQPKWIQGHRTARWLTFAAVWILAATVLVLFAWRVRNAPVGPSLVAFGAILALLPAFTASSSPGASTRKAAGVDSPLPACSDGSVPWQPGSSYGCSGPSAICPWM